MQLLPQAPGELANAIRSIESIPALADMVASFMDLKSADKQEILATFDLKARLDRMLAALGERIEVLKVSREIDEKTREALDERQKQAVSARTAESDPQGARRGRRLIGRTRGPQERRRKAGMPPEVEEQALRELERLERMPDGVGEYSMIRTYLDWLVAMPWAKLDTEQTTSNARARSSTRITTAWRRSSAASSSSWRSASSIPRVAARSCASSVRRASARPRSARASPGRWD